MFELDLLWIVVGGESPLDYLRADTGSATWATTSRTTSGARA